MAPLLFVLLLGVPIAELWAILQVADEIGIGSTILLLIGISIAGAWLLRQQGTATWRSMQASLRRGQMPAKEATDGALILLGGALLLTPGFLTDVVGLLLLIPPTRAALKTVVRRAMRRRIERRWPGAGAARHMRDARVVRVERTEPTSPAAVTPDPLPSERDRRDEDGSPDKR